MTIKDRAYYENLFINYPDVVELPIFCEIMGGIADSTARKLLQNNHVRHFCVSRRFGDRYMIPKEYIIDYILSEHYGKYKDLLKAQV